ncbi:4070_t:CDS:2 [Cetraspora pellucida]|uniref:4070_t:CDS:1 n=1 Tax=Cetraspora pellucida TaxID=1433469 RepID=A0A9N9C9Y6_9GLOM|nr:4070_t:CDS:2 [Cetraspora pellucida]
MTKCEITITYATSSNLMIDPRTGDFMLVIDFMRDGDLRHFLLNQQLSSSDKLYILLGIAEQLGKIHKQKIIHRDLHSGNILIYNQKTDSPTIAINDFGISRPANESSDNEVYGVIPYIAPEILRGRKFTTASDIYSFGMMMWEITSGQKPFSDYSHDAHLIYNICNGLRPPIINGTPQPFIELMIKCWETDPSKRPTADTIAVILDKMRYSTELPRIKASEIAVHPDAVFKSRPLSSLIKTASTLHYTQLNCLSVTDYVTKENLFNIMNESPMSDVESFISKIDHHEKNDEVFYPYQYDNLIPEKVLNNEGQSFNNHENTEDGDKNVTKETLLDIISEKSTSHHKSNKANQHPKMNLISLLNDQDSNDQGFYFCQCDSLNFENIYQNDNISLTKDDQCSAMELVPFQCSMTNLMPLQCTTTNLMPFQYSATDLIPFQNDHHFYYNCSSTLSSENFLNNNQVQIFDYNQIAYSMQHNNEGDQYQHNALQ